MSAGERRPVVLAVVLLIAAVAVARWLLASAGSTDPSMDRVAPQAHTCVGAALERVRGLEVGDSFARDWTVDAIECLEEDPCTHVVLTNAPSVLSLRVCPHREGGPHAPATRGGSDLFYDLPPPTASEVPEETILLVLAEVAGRLSAGEGE